MRDFRVKLQSIKFPLWIFYRGEIATFGCPGDTKPLRQRYHFITMAIPDIELVA